RWKRGTANCASRFSRPTKISLTTWPGWHLKALHLDDVNPSSAQAFCEFLRGSFVGDESLNSIKRPYLRDTSPPQFAEIVDDRHFFGRADHQVVQLRFEHVRGGRAVFEVEAVNRQEQAVGVEFAHGGFRMGPDKGAGNRPHQAANHDE